MGNCQKKPKIGNYTGDVDYQVDGYFNLTAVKFGIHGDAGTYQTKNSNIETSMHLYRNPVPVRKARNSEKDVEVDIEPISSDEIPLFSKPLLTPTNNDSGMGTSTPVFHILEKSPTGNSADIYKRLEAVREKYHRTKVDRDQLVQKNFALSKDLQKAEALHVIKIRETEQLVQQSQTESTRWKELATAVQTANAGLVDSMETMSKQLKCLVPETFARVKHQQNSLVEELEHCETTIKNEIEQRRNLEMAKEELEAKLRQEKASALASANAQNLEYQDISKKLETETNSLEQQIQDVTLELENTKRQTKVFEREGQLLKWMFGQQQMDEEEFPANHDGEPLRSNEEAKVVLSDIIEQVGQQRNYYNKLDDLCKCVLMERDRIMEQIELLKVRLGNDCSVDGVVRLGDRQSSLESPSEIEMSDTERVKQHWIRRGSSYQNLTAKIGVLQMESRHKSKMIQVLEQEHEEDYSVVRHEHRWASNVKRSPAEKWEYSRFHMFGYGNAENGHSGSSESAELGDDEGESVLDRTGNYGTEKVGKGN